MYKPCDYNAECERCGKQYKASKLSKEWTGLWVCTSCGEPRHPQLSVRAVLDNPTVPWVSNEVEISQRVILTDADLTPASPYYTTTLPTDNSLPIWVQTTNSVRLLDPASSRVNGFSYTIRNIGTKTIYFYGLGEFLGSPTYFSISIAPYVTNTITYHVTANFPSAPWTYKAWTL